jgi:hypothetical protein
MISRVGEEKEKTRRREVSGKDQPRENGFDAEKLLLYVIHV